MLSSEIPWNSVEPLGECVYTKRIQVTNDMFHGIPRESIVYLLYPMPRKSLGISVFEEFYDFSKFLENFRKILETYT